MTLVGPNTDALCLTRLWSFHLLFVIALAPLLVKVYRMHRLVGKRRLNRESINTSGPSYGNFHENGRKILMGVGTFWATVFSTATFVLPRLLQVRDDSGQGVHVTGIRREETGETLNRESQRRRSPEEGWGDDV
eukprot:CAMPEP_0197434494 /NCGR_PEP_ID=MMETSP1175-20131217/2209_1 /TAXON_ID=1003142 /ORGANISM="Triceratium dubium, Strain CCMP147" /LENGTH=133 /DNA_ID=CAMNT_0042963237 /DNA_START=25 /DNA_END=427 /DNA_ORIENTATION=-